MSRGDAQVMHRVPTLWAQRNQVVLLTFVLESCEEPSFEFEPNKVIFTAKDHSKTINYTNELEFYDEINAEGCIWSKKGPGVECTLQKKNSGFWPRLLKDKAKAHWLKVDFNKWMDEDELEEENDPPVSDDDYDYSQMMSQMGDGAGGMMPGLDDDNEEDSDDEDIPDLEDSSTSNKKEDNV